MPAVIKEHLELHKVAPGLAGRFIDELPGDSSTKNQALAALRHFFDTLVSLGSYPSQGTPSTGHHSTCRTAVEEAKRRGYWNANGCCYCSSECHTT